MEKACPRYPGTLVILGDQCYNKEKISDNGNIRNVLWKDIVFLADYLNLC